MFAFLKILALPDSAHAPCFHGYHAKAGEEKSNRKPLTSCSSYPPSGFRRLQPNIVHCRGQEGPSVIGYHALRGRSPRTLLWAQGHIERKSISSYLPPCLPALLRLPSLTVSEASPGNHCDLTPLCHSLSSPHRPPYPTSTPSSQSKHQAPLRKDFSTFSKLPRTPQT